MSYKAYKPTPLESRIDRLVRLVSPRIQTQRVFNREKEHYFRYLSALPTSSRKNSNAQTSGETMRGSREKLQVMWNAINAVDNSGLCTSIINKFQMYVCGALRWQSRCGDRKTSDLYEDYMKLALSKSLDVTGRFSLRQMLMLDLRAILIKGDVATNIVRDGNQIQLQGIEADRIGNPYDYSISNNYIRGLELDDSGRLVSARIFYRDRPTGTYKYEQTIPFTDQRGLPRLLFLANPISYDDYRGISVFKTAIDSATYIDRIREYELQALMWAASQSGVFHTKSGALPEGLPFDRINPLQDISGNTIETYQVRPNTVTALGVGEEVNMFQHDRPSPNVLGMLEATVRDISVGTGLSYGMVWDMSGYTGPAVRAISSQDARTIETWQWLLRENKLDPVAMIVLGNAIANKELPFHPQWMKWEWFFPAKSTIDVGRESDANIQEIHAGIQTGARVAANDGQDIEEIKIQRGREIEAEIEVAQKVATDVSTDGQPVMWQEVYQLMCPKPGKGGGGFGMPGMTPPPGDDGAATGGGNGAAAGGRNGGGNGAKSKSKMRQDWYSDDEARDERGRWTDGGVTISEDIGEHAPKVGEPFLAYRLGRHGKLENDNAGNSLGVANHLAMVDDMEAPSPSGGTGDRVMAFQVTPHEEWGDYEHFDAEKGGGKKVIGRATTNQVVVYSFPKGGKFTHKKVAEVPLTEIRSTLKKLHGTDSFDEAGARAGAEAIRRAFKKAQKFRATHIWYREDQARDEGGRFADEGRGDPGFRNEPEAYAKAQLEDVPPGKPGITHETANGQPAVVHRDESGNANGILRHNGKGMVTDVAVATGSRGQGIGGKLVDAAKDKAGARFAKGPFTEHGASLVEHGKLGIAGQPGELDKAIADYKPDRTLSDPTKITPIDKAVPGVSYTPYSQTPFFDHVNAIQGNAGKTTNDILKHGVGDYIKNRDLLFDTIPVTKVKLDNVVATQQMVNTERVQQLVDDPSTGGKKPLQIVKQGGKLYVLNGHHRIAALLAGGAHPEIDAHVLDLDHPEPVPPKDNSEIPRYVDELHKTPSYHTVLDRLRSLGADNGDRETYSMRQNLSEAGKARVAAGAPIESMGYKDLTTEEQKVHDDAVREATDKPGAIPKPGEDKVAVIVTGKPASGKSRSRDKRLSELGLSEDRMVIVNADDARESIPQYRGWNASATQFEASLIRDRVAETALNENKNVLFDEVGAKADKLNKKIELLKEAGYKVHLVHIDAPLYQTAKASHDRFLAEGRFIDPDYSLAVVDDKTKPAYEAAKNNPALTSAQNVDNEGYKGIVTERIEH